MNNIHLGADIPLLSMQMSQANIKQQWGIGIMRQALDQVEKQGQMMAEMLNGIAQAVSVEGSSFSVRI